MSDLLFELGVEEVPAGYVRPALEEMSSRLRSSLCEARLGEATVRATGTPRRLVLCASGIAARQADVEVSVQGPPAKVAFDAEGRPTKAVLGFAAAQGADPAQIEVRQTERGSYCFLTRRERGRAAAEVLPRLLEDIVRAAPFPKAMRWAGSDGRFARPVRYIVALLDDQVLSLAAFGVSAGRETRGHPFLAPRPIALANADFGAYREALRRAGVVVDADERREALRRLLRERTRALVGRDGPPPDEALLDEVTMHVEWPFVVEGRFDESFLAVPSPVLEAAMKAHQRYFPVARPDGSLIARFLAAANRADDRSGLIREGNERVLRARLADARFFWDADGKTTLADRVDRLDQIQFLAGLGTYRDKVHRLEALTRRLAAAMGIGQEEASSAARAALLCKSDLLTEMVGEFPSLQGVVGRLYALRDGEPEAVARAIEEHYQPKSGADPLPGTRTGRLLALAEKLDNLAGGFLLGLQPTGSQDPYALRRQALAAVRLAEAFPGARLDALASAAFDALRREEERPKAEANLRTFLRERVYQLCLDRGAPHDLARAAMAVGWADVGDLFARVAALKELAARPEWPALVAVVERTYNIGRAAPTTDLDETLFREEEERRLWQMLRENAAEVRSLIERGAYVRAGLRFAEIFAEPVHAFFEKVFVNVEEERLRANRLALVWAINRLFGERFADLSEIVTGVAENRR